MFIVSVSSRKVRSVDRTQSDVLRFIQLGANTMRTLILLLYGAGLRAGEARRLTLVDIDLKDAVLTVRRSKFYKTRLVPVGPQLAEALEGYARRRAARPLPKGRHSSLLANRDGAPLVKGTMEQSFRRLRQKL